MAPLQSWIGNWVLLILVVVGLVGFSAPVALGQAEQPQPIEGPQESGGQETQPITGLELEGQLKAVDVDGRFLLVTGAGGEEMLVHFDDQTQVAGPVDSPQGLTGQSGTWLHIEYRAEGQRAIAERIEVLQGSPSQPEPGPAQ